MNACLRLLLGVLLFIAADEDEGIRLEWDGRVVARIPKEDIAILQVRMILMKIYAGSSGTIAVAHYL